MAAINEQAIRELAARGGDGSSIITCYLDVDGRTHPRRQDYEAEFERLSRTIAGADPKDLARVAEHVRSGFDRSNTRGLAIFASSADDLWEVFTLPVPVRSQLVVAERPYIRQLEGVVDNNERFGVLLVDKQDARMFVFELGELVSKDALFEELPRHEDDGGTWTKDHVADHSDEMAHQHLRHVAAAIFELYQQADFDHLLLGASTDIRSEVERLLHPYLQERLAGYLSVEPSAPDETIITASLAAEADVERLKEAALVNRAREFAASGGRGVIGLEDTLAALADQKVDQLLVSAGFIQEGWACGGCGGLAAIGPTCPRCQGSMTKVHDVIENAIEAALAQSGSVDICVGNADLDVAGSIAAITRY